MMKGLILVVIAAVVLGIGLAAEQFGLPVPLKGRKYRALSVLVILPIALVCALAVGYTFVVVPLWAGLIIAPILVTLCVAFAILLVGRILPAKISSREDEDY